MAIKHKQYNELGDPKPSAANWGFSFLAVGLLLSVMLWGQLAATGLRYARLQDKFAELAGNGKHLHRLLDDERFQPILEQHQDALHSLLPVVSFIDKGNLNRALQLMDQPSTPHHPLLISLREHLAELANADSEYQTVKDQQDESSELHDELIQSFVDLQNVETDGLFGEQKNDGQRAFSIGFYRSGLLQGLPLVKSIPESVNTFEDLSMFAKHYRDGTPREKHLFEKHLEDWKARGETLRPQIEDYLSKHELRGKTMNKLSVSRNANQEKAEMLLRQVALELTRMVLSPSLVQTYQRFQAMSGPLGILAPDLKTT